MGFDCTPELLYMETYYGGNHHVQKENRCLLCVLSVPLTSQSPVMSAFFGSSALALATPGLDSRQLAIGSYMTGWWNLPSVSGATVHRDWPMKGYTFVRCHLLPATSPSSKGYR